MPRRPAIWLLCFGLVLTRLLGLHVHACAGVGDTPHEHGSPHYADAGLLFGEHHTGDHDDKLELNLTPDLAAGKLQFDATDGGPALPAADRLAATLSTGWLSVRVPRGPPPVARASRPADFAPPLRGPPPPSLA